MIPRENISQSLIIYHSLVDAFLRVLHLLQPCARHLCHPLLERLCLGRRNGLYKTEQLLCISHIGKAELAVGCTQFQPVTSCNRLVAFLYLSVFYN